MLCAAKGQTRRNATEQKQAAAHFDARKARLQLVCQHVSKHRWRSLGETRLGSRALGPRAGKADATRSPCVGPSFGTPQVVHYVF